MCLGFDLAEDIPSQIDKTDWWKTTNSLNGPLHVRESAILQPLSAASERLFFFCFVKFFFQYERTVLERLHTNLSVQFIIALILHEHGGKAS